MKKSASFERRCQAGNARKARQAGAAGGFLPSPADQREPAHQRQDSATARAASLLRNPRKRGASSELGRRHADLSQQGPQPAALVSRRLQPQHPDASSAPPPRPPEAPRRKLRLEVTALLSVERSLPAVAQICASFRFRYIGVSPPGSRRAARRENSARPCFLR